jgi:urease accessory protein
LNALPAVHLLAPEVPPVWVGRLSLEFARSGPRTVLARRRHQGPLMVQRGFYEPDGACQVYVLHPPGGIVGGDRLSLQVSAGPDSRALITTPAATKIYRSPSRPSKQEQRLEVAERAVLEWLPQETILYVGAEAESETLVQLGQGSQFIGWEITCLGHDGRGFSRGHWLSRWRLQREGQLLWSERAALKGGGAVLDAAWGLAGRPVVGTLVATGTRAEHVDAIRCLMPAASSDWFSASLLGEVLVCRYLGYSAEEAKRFFHAAWGTLRSVVSGRTAHAPRVWAT